MTFEQWIEKIDDEIYNFITEFNPNYECEVGSDFCAYPLGGAIEWSFIYVDSGGKAFYKDFVERFPKANGFGLFTLSLLHEIGHLETASEYVNDKEERSRTYSCADYFKLHNEVIATNWAGEWINNHYAYATAIDNFFTKLLHDCYADLITE
jgi:hypothetical protein